MDKVTIMYTLRLITAGLIVSIATSFSYAEPKHTPTEKRYSFSLNNSLLPSANSTVGMGNFSFELYRNTLYPIDFINQHYYSDYKGVTTIATLGYGVLHGLFVMLPVSVAYHEFGHARGLLALDSNSEPTYYDDLPNLNGSGNPFPAITAGKTYYHILWSFIIGKKAGFVLPKDAVDLVDQYYSGLDKEKVVATAQQLIDSPTIDQISVWAGGMNNQAILASTIEDQAILQNGYFLFDILALSINKLMPVLYPTADIPSDLKNAQLFKNNHLDLMQLMNDHGSIKRHYRMKNIIPDYTAEMSTTGCFLSFLLSGSTYQGIYNIYNYVSNGRLFTPAYNYKGVYLPNTSFFFTSQGLSLRFKAAYQWDPNLLLMATYEVVYKGKSVHECKLSAYKTIPQLANLQVHGGILISSGTQ
ncbi:MAG: hypothetical protein Q8Q56_02835, partial [Alphaproteobacteria bacterium]|nr:hypothetical protein [Alphaproteobacteria bacterium]